MPPEPAPPLVLSLTALALRLASEGADIVVNFFRNRAPAEQTTNEIQALGRRALLVEIDSPTWCRAGEPADQGIRLDRVLLAAIP